MPAITAEEPSGEVDKAANQDTNGEVCFDFTFPVTIEDGRRVTISWNKGDDLEKVASLFAEEHAIPPEELTTIKAFLAQATNMSEGSKEGTNEPNVAVGEQKEEFDLTEAQKQLEEMGLGDVLGQGVLLELLNSHGGSVERVIDELTMEGQ